MVNFVLLNNMKYVVLCVKYFQTEAYAHTLVNTVKQKGRQEGMKITKLNFSLHGVTI